MDSYIITLAVVTAFFTSVILTPLFMPIYGMLRNIFYVPFVRAKLLKKAVAEGHVVTAHLKETHGHTTGTATGSRSVPGKYSGTYEYQYDGKTYRRYLSSYDLPATVELYYQTKPYKASLASSFGLAENPTWFLQYLALVIVNAALLYKPALDLILANPQMLQF